MKADRDEQKIAHEIKKNIRNHKMYFHWAEKKDKIAATAATTTTALFAQKIGNKMKSKVSHGPPFVSWTWSTISIREDKQKSTHFQLTDM